MKVSIEHSERVTGWISKKRFPLISLRVEFSEEEKSIINTANIGGVIIMERDHPADINDNNPKLKDIWYLTFGKLLRNQQKGLLDEYTVTTPAEARMYEENLKTALRQAKDYLEASRPVEQKSSTFEL